MSHCSATTPSTRWSSPLRREYAGPIHVYGGDFMNQTRSMWDAETLEERPADGATSRLLFEEANARADAM